MKIQFSKDEKSTRCIVAFCIFFDDDTNQSIIHICEQTNYKQMYFQNQIRMNDGSKNLKRVFGKNISSMSTQTMKRVIF